jgi:hypothetical protein
MDRASRGTHGGPGRIEFQTPVGTFRVVVLDELREHQPKVLLAKNDHMIEALVPQSPDDALRDRIGTGRLHWAEHGLDAQAPGPPSEVPTINAVGSTPRNRDHAAVDRLGGESCWGGRPRRLGATQAGRGTW